MVRIWRAGTKLSSVFLIAELNAEPTEWDDVWSRKNKIILHLFHAPLQSPQILPVFSCFPSPPLLFIPPPSVLLFYLFPFSPHLAWSPEKAGGRKWIFWSFLSPRKPSDLMFIMFIYTVCYKCIKCWFPCISVFSNGQLTTRSTSALEWINYNMRPFLHLRVWCKTCEVIGLPTWLPSITSMQTPHTSFTNNLPYGGEHLLKALTYCISLFCCATC